MADVKQAEQDFRNACTALARVHMKARTCTPEQQVAARHAKDLAEAALHRARAEELERRVGAK